MDLRLSKALGTSQGFWYRMQAQWDMAQAKRRFEAKVKPIPRAELQSETTA
jgi:antitoxin HigA-1